MAWPEDFLTVPPPGFIPGAADAPTLDQLLGPPPPGYAPMSPAPTFRASTSDLDRWRVLILIVGLVVGLSLRNSHG